MNLRTRTLAAAAALTATALVAAGCASSSGGTDADSTEPIVFGVSGPLTGNQAEYGENWQEGFAIALDEINGAGGVNGREVQIDFQDSQGEASQATPIAQRFIEHARRTVPADAYSHPA